MTRRRIHVALAATVLAVGLVIASIAVASDGGKKAQKSDETQLRANLIGFNEVPVVNTAGHATLRMTMTPTQITFTLTYADLSGNPAAAHVHAGQKGVNGGVSFFFCGGGGKPPCPASTSGTVTGTVVAADVLGPTGTQQFPAGSLDAIERAIRAGVAYANMHTANSPGGEIRDQVHVVRGNGDDDNQGDDGGDD
jgi:CHRD domain